MYNKINKRMRRLGVKKKKKVSRKKAKKIV